MVNEQLLNYIKEQLEEGVNKEEIKNKLMTQGWQETDVNEAFVLLSGSISISQPSEALQKKEEAEISSIEKPKIGLIKIIIGIFIIILAGTGTSLATRIWDPLWNPFRPTPEKVISQMTKKISEVKTIHNDINFELDLKDIKNKIEFGVKGNLQTDSDTTDQQNPKSKAILNGSLATKGMEFSLGLETIQIGETAYIKITTLPLLLQPFLAIIGIDFKQLENQWIKIDKESSKQLLKQFTDEEDKEEFEKLYGELKKKQEEEKKEQERMIEELKKIIENKKLYIVKKEMADEKIGDKKAYHYLVALNNEEVKKILPELFKAMEGSEKFLNGGEFEEILLDKFFGKIGEIAAEIWIGKKDNYLYKIKIEKEIEAGQFKETEEGMVKIKADIEFSNFNQSVQIEAPKEFKTFEEIFLSFLKKGGLFGLLMQGKTEAEGETETKNTSEIMKDLGKMQYIASTYFPKKDKYINLCSDKEIIVLRDKIITKGGSNYSCNVQTGAGAGKSYCIEVKLKSGDWRCIDSDPWSDWLKEYTTDPACAPCIGKTCKCE